MAALWDIHTHILPNVDDGAQALAEAVTLLKQAYADGTRGIILTPHYRGAYRENPPIWLQENFDALLAAAQEANIPISLHMGREIHYQSGVMELVSQGKIETLAQSNYVLLEFMPQVEPNMVRMAVQEALEHGYTPILAHIERYTCFRKEHAMAWDIRQMGALVQLNVDSVMGQRGFFVKHYCRSLLKHQLVDFIASDAHEPRNRPPLLMECYTYVKKRFGRITAQKIFVDNPKIIVENGII